LDPADRAGEGDVAMGLLFNIALAVIAAIAIIITVPKGDPTATNATP
jgi:hypothetical protein